MLSILLSRTELHIGRTFDKLKSAPKGADFFLFVKNDGISFADLLDFCRRHTTIIH